MTTIGGETISQVTIDGVQVTQITIDGEVIWSNRTIVESWEDGNHNDWNVGYSLNVSSAYPTYDGTYSARHSFNKSIKTYSNPGNGLGTYPQQGDVSEALLYVTDLQTGQYIYWVGVENVSTDNHSYGLGAEIRANGNNSDFYFRFSDRQRNMLKEQSIPDPRNRWLKLRIYWADDDNHRAELIDLGGDVWASLTGSSTLYRGNTICLHGNNYGNGGRQGTAYWDSIQLV